MDCRAASTLAPTLSCTPPSLVITHLNVDPERSLSANLTPWLRHRSADGTTSSGSRGWTASWRASTASA